MPTYYENAVAQAEFSLTGEEYASAWLLYQSRFGRLKNNTLKTVLCVVVAILSGCYIPSYLTQYATFWIPAAVAAAALAAAVYFQILLPREEYKKGLTLFSNSRFLALDAKVELYRDSYVEENRYEKITGHWTDTLGCSETKELFVVMGGWDRQLLVLPKRTLSPQDTGAVSSHFQNTFVRSYKFHKGGF